MKVFISWSGDRSRAIAEVLRRWLPSVLQAVRPYFSPDDVAKGSRWSAEIAKELEASSIGLLIITPENQEAPWLLFEAGALAKNLDRSKVCPLLFGGLEPTDVKGPLVQFQAAEFSHDELKRVVKMINDELADAALLPDVFDTVFEMWWPKLNEEVSAELRLGDASDLEARRSERDLLEEVLALTRRFARERGRRVEFDHPAWEDLLMSITDLARVARIRSPDETTAQAVRRVLRPLDFLTHQMSPDSRLARHFRRIVAELDDLAAVDLEGPSGSTESAVSGS